MIENYIRTLIIQTPAPVLLLLDLVYAFCFPLCVSLYTAERRVIFRIGRMHKYYESWLLHRVNCRLAWLCGTPRFWLGIVAAGFLLMRSRASLVGGRVSESDHDFSNFPTHSSQTAPPWSPQRSATVGKTKKQKWRTRDPTKRTRRRLS